MKDNYIKKLMFIAMQYPMIGSIFDTTYFLLDTHYLFRECPAKTNVSLK
jgi:hypothetical protein